MMDPELSGALRELELSTDALLETDTADVGRLCAALERRASAITRVAALADEIARQGSAAVQRLNSVLRRGNEAARKVLSMKQDAVQEWNRLNRVARGVEEGRPKAAHQVDYSG